MKKKIFNFVWGLLFVSIFLTSFVSANFIVGNVSHSVPTSYGPGELLSGWFNISLDNVASDSLLTVFGNSINILDFLNENNFDCDNDGCSCIPENCERGYSIVNGDTGDSSKSFAHQSASEWLVGIKLNGDVDSISSFNLDVVTDVGSFCLYPLTIDIGDDGNLEFIATKTTNEPCIYNDAYGCFDDFNTSKTNLSDVNYYCEEINLPGDYKNFKIGAIIEGNGLINLELSLNMDDDEFECTTSISTSGEVSCNVNLTETLTEPTTAEVCIRKKDGAEYEIKYEDNSTCGFVRDNYFEFIETSEHDFEIFARPFKYASVDSFRFNQESLVGDDADINLANSIDNYINDNYNNDNCAEDCIIPIRFDFKTPQSTTISNFTLSYTSNGLPRTETNLYVLEESSVILNSDFLKLDLAYSNLSVPSNLGNHTLTLELEDTSIFSQSIQTKAIPQILGLVQQTIPALINYPLVAILAGSANNLTFNWNFGDGIIENSNSNSIEHIYNATGNYNVILTVRNQFGNLSKTFPIVVVSPREYINDSLNDSKNDIKKIENEINQLPEWIKNHILQKVKLEDLKNELNSLEMQYDGGFVEDAKILEIMQKISKLNIPNELKISQEINSFSFFPNNDELDLDALEILGAGTPDQTREVYSGAASNWVKLNLGVLLESKTYSFYFDDVKEDIVSYVKVILDPLDSLNEFYFVIEGNPEEIVFNREVNSRDVGQTAVGIIFSDLKERETIEFLLPGKVDISNLPIYISPEFQNLELGTVPGPCDHDGKCESGEDYKNCRSDCKPIGWTVFWFFVLFLIAFIVYIALQEWYKKHYESKLFPNKSQLFNLVNFMSVSLNQGIKKGKIYGKLKDLGWGGEQLDYVWKKLQGKRVGTWEIPIFKWVENKKVKEELAKRQGVAENQELRSK
jgi:PKD repeat protein